MTQCVKCEWVVVFFEKEKWKCAYVSFLIFGLQKVSLNLKIDFVLFLLVLQCSEQQLSELRL